jgi:hypothetical protein
MGLLSCVLFMLLPFDGWVLYANLVSPLALGAFFIGEHVLRYRWHPEFERVPWWAGARAWRERGAAGRQGEVGAAQHQGTESSAIERKETQWG